MGSFASFINEHTPTAIAVDLRRNALKSCYNAQTQAYLAHYLDKAGMCSPVNRAWVYPMCASFVALQGSSVGESLPIAVAKQYCSDSSVNKSILSQFYVLLNLGVDSPQFEAKMRRLLWRFVNEPGGLKLNLDGLAWDLSNWSDDVKTCWLTGFGCNCSSQCFE